MKKHWWLVVFVAVTTVGLALVPLWYAYSQVPEGYVLAGIGRDDEYGLITWAKQAQAGHFLFWNPYSLKAEKRNLFNPLFLLLGVGSKLVGNDLVLTFNLARIGLGLIFLLTSYWFFGLFLKDFRDRLAAFLLVCFSSGLGWLLVFVPSGKASFLFNAVSSTEALSFPSLLFYPHFTAALSLLMVCFGAYLRFLEKGQWRFWLLSCLAGSLLIAVHPHESLALALVPVLYLFLCQQAKFQSWLRTIFYGLGLLPMAVYFALLSQFDPVYKQFTQTPMAPLSWLDFGAAYGLLLPLAGWGSYQVFKSSGKQKSLRPLLFALAWVLTVLGLLFVPFAFQRKMVMGLHLPLIILAVAGLRSVWVKMKNKGLVWLSFGLLLLVLWPQNLYFVRGVVKEMEAEPEIYRLSTEKMTALRWLEENSNEGEVVLSNPSAGLLIPAFAGRKVFLGHWGNTNFAEEKAGRLYTFYEPETADDWREAFLAENSISYLYYDRENVDYNRWVFTVERQKGQRLSVLEKSFRPEDKDYFKKVFENQATVIYQVKD